MMNLRIAIKIALGIAILANPLPVMPMPVVMDSTDILSEYKKDFHALLEQEGITRENHADIFMDVFYRPEMNTREGISDFSTWFQSLDLSLGEDPFPLYHKFGGGLYTREIHIPQGYTIIGKIHKHEAMVYLIKGESIFISFK